MFTRELARATINAPKETTAKAPTAMPIGTRRDVRIGACGLSSSVVMIVSSLLFTKIWRTAPERAARRAPDRQLDFRFGPQRFCVGELQ